MQVKAEVVKIEKHDKPIYELLVDLISGHHMTKLILDLTFIKSSSSSSRYVCVYIHPQVKHLHIYFQRKLSLHFHCKNQTVFRKSRDAVRGLLHIHQHKPEFCELHIVHGGKLVHLREEDAEGVIEDDQGMITTAKTRDKRSFIGRLGMIMFPGSNRDPPPTNTVTDPTNRWEDHVQEIENYFQKLMSFQSDEGSDCDGDTGSGQSNQTDSAPRVQDDPNDNMVFLFSFYLTDLLIYWYLSLVITGTPIRVLQIKLKLSRGEWWKPNKQLSERRLKLRLTWRAA